MHRLRGDRGAVAIEFILIAPFLLLVLFAIVAYGRVFNEMQVLNSAAREGGRVAALRGSTDEVRAAVASAASPLTVSGISVSSTCTEATSGSFVTVSWTHGFSHIKNSVPFPLPMPATQTIKSVFRCE